jgi:hypothetical protein
MSFKIDTTLANDLKSLDTLIRRNEQTAIQARWEFGRLALLSYAPGKKQLAKGILDAIAQELHIHRSEVSSRIKFAKKYPTADEVSTVIETYQSWSAIRQQALADCPRHGAKRQHTALQRVFKVIDAIDPVALDQPDMAVISALIERLQRLAANIITLRAT